MNIKELEILFYQEKRSNILPFVINDSVEILEGNDKGKFASVISIRSVAPELTYLVEKGDGSGDLVISSRAIKLI
jgi:hypothetical protein